MNEKIIPIFYACDDNFAKYMIVSISSLINNADPKRNYSLHILHTNISEEMQEATLRLKKDNFTIKFEDVTHYLEKIRDKLPLRHYYTKTTYFRLFIAEMFPEYGKAIYIDSDTVVPGDISKLYDTNLCDNLVGGCHEQAMVQVDVFGTYAEEVVGVSRHNFFNAGMILINCERWREIKLLDKFFTLLGEYNFVVTQDEDYLNLICKDHVCWLDQRWNTEVTAGFIYPYDISEAYIIHYIMVNKPWHYKDCGGADIFWRYACKTEMYEAIKAELEAYTDEERERDRMSAENLIKMAEDEIHNELNYQRILNATTRSADRVAVVQKMRDYEERGIFDLDLEDDPPTKELLPDQIDYFRRSAVDRIKTEIAYKMAKSFLEKIQREGQMIIREVRGLENMKNLESGAVITCNHFNPFDTFAMHEAYLRSGVKGKTLYRVIREGNYTSFGGFYGYLMRNFYTLPLSSNRHTMNKFSAAVDSLLRDGNFVLIYPEQSLWWNYRKPKPLKAGAYSIAFKSRVPVLPCFITMKDSFTLGEDGYPIQEYTINIGEPIYPDMSLSRKEAINNMMEENARVWREIYERDYNMPLEYTTKEAVTV